VTGARPADGILVITVVRSGGFAGLRQQWQAAVGDDQRDEWMPLIQACPWGSVPTDPTSRDRFLWRIEARGPRLRRSATVPDAALDGPWRALVDRVRETPDPAAG
jgi:emfourin